MQTLTVGELKTHFSEVLEKVKNGEEMGIEILNVKSAEAASFYKLPRLAHKDPFDRMVIWQAILRKMMLISSDREFRQYRQYDLRLVW